MKKSKTSAALMQWKGFRLRIFFEGIAVGLLTGFVVVAYRFLFEEAENLRGAVYKFLQGGSVVEIALWFGALLLIALFLGRVIRYDPVVGGSGVPQVKGMLLNQLKINWLRVIVLKFIGGIAAIFTGLSLGSGGPSVQLGACVGQGFSRSLGRLKVEEKYLVTSGASAGLAAIFNAPLAGVIFALEEMHKNFSPVVLTGAMAAALSADFVSQRFFGQQPLFQFEQIPVLPMSYYIYLIGLGISMGLLGLLFNVTLVKALDYYARSGISVAYRPLAPILLAGILGFTLPQTLGAGHQLMDIMIVGGFTLTMLAILFIVKFLFTMVSYASGVPGGIFLPLLVLGALAGNFYGMGIAEYLQVDSQYTNNFIVLAMAAYFTAIFKAPITGSILITEMTGSLSHLFAAITVSMTAYIVADLLNAKSLYEALVERMLKHKDRERLLGTYENKVIVEVAVALGSGLDNKRIKDIQWPVKCLLVGIKRGEKEIIPKGNTVLHVGDYLIVLTDESEEYEVRRALTKLSG